MCVCVCVCVCVSGVSELTIIPAPQHLALMAGGIGVYTCLSECVEWGVNVCVCEEERCERVCVCVWRWSPV